MILSPDYRSIRALFEGSGVSYFEEDGWEVPSWGFNKEFSVGPILYEMGIHKDGGFWNVAFKYIRMVGSTEELLQYFTNLRGRRIDERELEQIKQLARNSPYDILGLGNSSQVFGEMFLILNQFIQKYQPQCFGFSCAYKRVSLYDKMFSRKFPPPHWVKDVDTYSGEPFFMFCQNELES